MTIKIGYVLKSFPEPTETFIAEEALSLQAAGVDCCFMQVYEGTTHMVHPSARILLERVPQKRLGGASHGQVLIALALMLLRAPIRTLRTLARIRTNPWRWCYFQSLVAARWYLAQGASALHVHFADINLVYAAAISDWTGLPFSVTTHRYDIFEDPLDPALTRELLHRADLVVTISEFNRRFMQQKYDLDEERIQIVRCGIDLEQFRFQARPARTGRLQLLNVASLTPAKAQSVLLEALAIVRSRGVEFSLEIIGAGRLLEDLQAQVATLGLEDSVCFHGAKPQDFVRQRLSAADFFVFSSRSEGLPVACIEALAMGTPAIATRIFGIPELIEHGRSGWLVPPDDAQALADAICEAAATPPDRIEAIRQQGRAAVERAFDRRACTLELRRLWLQILNDKD